MKNPLVSQNLPHSKNGETALNIAIKTAKEAGELLKDVTFDYCFISNLKRAKDTLKLILCQINQSPPIENNVPLNERDYGDLIGQDKEDAAKKFGLEQVEV